MKQHYVPRCYLKRFSENENGIYAYDKKSSKAYLAPLMSVCFKEDMYTISDKFVKESNEETGGHINPKSIETDYFASVVEKPLLKYLKELDKIKQEWETGKDHYRLCSEEKYELAMFLTIQYLRHPLLQKVLVDNYKRMEQASLDMMKEMMAVTTGKHEFRDLDVKLICEESVLHAMISYMDIDTLRMFSSAIASNIYVFWVSKGGDFYTSDFPIVVVPHVPEAKPVFMGLAQYGGELTMPLSPWLALSIYDRKYFKEKENMDCCFVEAGDKEVRKQNFVRYMYAERHLFSYKNDFRIVDAWYQIQGGKHVFCEPDHRAEIISGLGRY